MNRETKTKPRTRSNLPPFGWQCVFQYIDLVELFEAVMYVDKYLCGLVKDRKSWGRTNFLENALIKSKIKKHIARNISTIFCGSDFSNSVPRPIVTTLILDGSLPKDFPLDMFPNLSTFVIFRYDSVTLPLLQSMIHVKLHGAPPEQTVFPVCQSITLTICSLINSWQFPVLERIDATQKSAPLQLNGTFKSLREIKVCFCLIE